MGSAKKNEVPRLESIAKRVRKKTLEMIYRTKCSHIGSSFSAVEILVSLYFKHLSVSPARYRDVNRDRFILSKGHSCPALYAVLSERGFLDKKTLDGFSVNRGTLEHHPARNLKRGIEVSTGSLGHGLSVGAGMALAAKADRAGYRTFVLLSDGEADEGTVWEAAMFASHHRLDNLIAIIDCNSLQALGKTRDILDLEPFAEKWRSFGWAAREIDGHSFKQVLNSLGRVPFERGKPSVVIARTVKGKGVSFMENDVLWHYRCPDDNEFKKAAREIA